MFPSIQSLKQSKYLKSILTLFSGTALSLLVPILSSFVLDDLYSPEEFGVYTLFTSILVLFTAFAEGKYSLAIALPKEEEEAKKVFYLGIFVSSIVFLVLLFLLLFYVLIGQFAKLVPWYDWLSLLPFCVLLVGIYESQNYWLIRAGNFKILAKVKVAQAVLLASTQIILGYLGLNYWGLLIAQFLGYLLNFVLLNNSAKKVMPLKISEIPFYKADLKRLAKTYSNFPKYTLPSEFINILVNQLPTFFLGFFFGSYATGIYGLTHRILSLPISVLSKAVLDVFKEKASREYREQGSCNKTFMNTAALLFSLAVIPFTILFFFAPVLFEWAFNDKWKDAGTYAQILTPMYFFGFIASPLTYMFTIAQKQKEDFSYHIYILLSMLGVFGGSYFLFKNIKITLGCFVINYVLIYIFYVVRSYKFSKGDEKN